jgi:putative membrane protein
MTDDDAFDRGLAPERTALAWNRTALAFFGTGALTARVLAPDRWPLAVAVAAVAFVLATVTWDHGRRSYRYGERGTAAAPPWLMGVVAVGAAVLALGIAIAAALPQP